MPDSTDFVRFQQLASEDAGLFEQLCAAPEPEEFAALAVRLGAERRLVFTVDEVRAALAAARRQWMERHIA